MSPLAIYIVTAAAFAILCGLARWGAKAATDDVLAPFDRDVTSLSSIAPRRVRRAR